MQLAGVVILSSIESGCEVGSSLPWSVGCFWFLYLVSISGACPRGMRCCTEADYGSESDDMGGNLQEVIALVHYKQGLE